MLHSPVLGLDQILGSVPTGDNLYNVLIYLSNVVIDISPNYKMRARCLCMMLPHYVLSKAVSACSKVLPFYHTSTTIADAVLETSICWQRGVLLTSAHDALRCKA